MVIWVIPTEFQLLRFELYLNYDRINLEPESIFARSWFEMEYI
jgi:hypothetical protein